MVHDRRTESNAQIDSKNRPIGGAEEIVGKRCRSTIIKDPASTSFQSSPLPGVHGRFGVVSDYCRLLRKARSANGDPTSHSTRYRKPWRRHSVALGSTHRICLPRNRRFHLAADNIVRRDAPYRALDPRRHVALYPSERSNHLMQLSHLFLLEHLSTNVCDAAIRDAEVACRRRGKIEHAAAKGRPAIRNTDHD